MNKQNTMQPLGETKSLQNIVIDEVCQKISDAVIDAEATSEEKYITKQKLIATVYKGNIIKNLIMDCQSYTKYRPNETTGGIFVSWRRKEELPTGA